MTNHKPVLAPLALVLLLFATASTARTRVQGDWEADSDRSQKFTRILVVALSPDYNQRCAFERALVSSLRRPGVTAESTCNYLSSKEPLSRAAVEKIVADIGADAVVATRIVSSAVGSKEGATRDARGGGYYKPVGYGFEVGYYGYYGVPVVYGEFETAEAVTTISGKVILATNVYETRGASSVYGLTTSATKIDSRSRALAYTAPDIADQLRRDGLVP
jgi:hypothetical protein